MREDATVSIARHSQTLWKLALGIPLALVALMILGPIGIMIVVSFTIIHLHWCCY